MPHPEMPPEKDLVNVSFFLCSGSVMDIAMPKRVGKEVIQQFIQFLKDGRPSNPHLVGGFNFALTLNDCLALQMSPMDGEFPDLMKEVHREMLKSMRAHNREREKEDSWRGEGEE